MLRNLGRVEPDATGILGCRVDIASCRPPAIPVGAASCAHMFLHSDAVFVGLVPAIMFLASQL